MTSQQGKILFLKKQLANMFDVKILRDLYIYTSYINYEVLKIFFIGIELIDSKFYTVYPACDVIKIDLIIKQDGGRLVSFVLQYFRN